MVDAPRTPLSSPVLVGRDRELEQLAQAWRAAQQGRGQFVVITGDAGVGKSRLLAEVRARLTPHPIAVVAGACFEEDASFPYALLIDALRTLFVRWTDAQIRAAIGTAASELVKLLPELAQSMPELAPTPSLDPEAEKRRLFEALARFLLSLTAGPGDAEPLLVLLEDLHWSDATSLDFLHFFARRLRDFPILVLATYRREEVSARLAHLLAQLDRERRATEIVLRPLGRDEVAGMVRAIFAIERPIKADFLDLIVPLTEGNPFFVEEILKALVEAGDIFYQDGGWERKPAPELHVPRSVRDAVQRRLEHVLPAARQLLTLAAVAGQRVDFALLSALTGMDERALLGHIRELIDQQLVVELSAEAFAFRHALTREAVYATVLKRERKELHQRIAETLERLYAGSVDAHLADLADHFYQAGAWAQALDYARRAGERAQALFAPREALDHFTRALDAAQQLSLTPPFEVLRARAKAHDTLGDFDQACGDLEAALEIAQTSGNRPAEWQARLDLGFLWAARDYARSGDYLLQALDTARGLGEPAILAHTLNRVGNWHVNRDEPFEAQPYHEEALRIFQQLNDEHGVAETLELLGVMHYTGANPLQGMAYCEQAVPLFRQAGDRQGLIHSLGHVALLAHLDTEVSDRRNIAHLLEPAHQAVQLAREMSWRAGEAEALQLAALSLHPTGDFARALQCAWAALTIGEEIGHRFVIANGHRSLGMMYLDLLTSSAAQQHLEQALALAQAISSIIFVRATTGALAETCVLQGDLARAEALLGSVLGSEIPAGRMHLRWCWCVRAELAVVQGHPTRALHIIDMLLASAANIATFGIRGIPRLAKVRGEALAALGRLEEAEMALLDARAGAREQGRRSLLWRIQLSLGKLYHAIAREADAEPEFAAARAVIHELATPLPDDAVREQFLRRALAMIPATPAISPRQVAKQAFGGLTAREREVAALVAQGKSNREIAEALTIAEGTAERHVANILSKLGFFSRAQIAVWVVEKGLTKSSA